MKKALITLILALSLPLCITGCTNNTSQAPVPTNEESKSVEALPEETIEKDAIEGATASEDITDIYKIEYPTAAEDFDIYVDPVTNVTDDFIRGVDVSEVIVEENSGVKYSNIDGTEEDVFKIMADAGVNYARIRIWNDPYDKDGNPYGGGNNDLDTAIALGKRATKYGMKVLIDFHYSDFWADPNRQLAPKEWAHYFRDEKAAAVHDFTYDSLKALLDENVAVTMVQVGNETNYGMAGESDEVQVHTLMNEGAKAIREISKEYNNDIKVVLHYTNSTNYDEIDYILNSLKKDNVDYDIMGLSYYPFWAGTFEEEAAVMQNIKSFDKDVMIAETSYPFTLEDGDGHGNSADESVLLPDYTASIQSQSTVLRDVCKTAADNDALGVFYWGGTWVPVPGANPNDPSAGMEIWEKYGSGWASSYAAKYDPENVGKWYGGSAWDNMALFDFSGKALPSLYTFKYLQYGTNTESKIDFIPDIEVKCNLGEELKLPETVNAYFNNRNDNQEIPVTWDSSSIDPNVAGEYDITGEASSYSVNAHVIIDAINYVENSSFEETNMSMWKIASNVPGRTPTDIQEKEADAYEGTNAFHYYDTGKMDFYVEQTVTNLDSGLYKAYVYSQGGDFSKDDTLEFYVIVDGKEYTEKFMNDGWVNWQTPTISGIEIKDSATIGVRVKSCAKSWGTIDNFTLVKE